MVRVTFTLNLNSICKLYMLRMLQILHLSITGTGIVHQDIVEPSDHYIAVANLNQIKMEVKVSNMFYY